jgi:hypothetical protein
MAVGRGVDCHIAMLAWLVVGTLGRGAEQRLVDELVAAHSRSLMV